MNKGDKITIIFYVFLAISYVSVIAYMDKSFADIKMPGQINKPITELNMNMIYSTNKTIFFNSIADVGNYPTISPSHFVSVNIINQSKNIVYAQETFKEGFFTTTALVKHTIVPYSYQTMEIMDGDAKGTLLNARFTGAESSSTIHIDVKIHVQGKFSLFALYPKNLIEGQLSGIVDDFANYSSKISKQ